ncbi:LOW QUALITY PROTEIN: transmembrane protein 232 [Pelodytes ibericus]
MPIFKVPVVQQFGIISATYHLELQKRLLEKTEHVQDKSLDHRNPLEITKEFIRHFNNAEQSDEQCLLDAAKKILERCKRRTGLNSKGSGNHVNLHHAWMDLILLAQCKGRIKEDALDILLVSMDLANINQEHIPLLFFIAESVLYRMCCDVAQKPYLVSSEVKLSKLGFLTFLRLYIFYLTGQLQDFKEQKERLSTYLFISLSLCEETYQPYPNVLFSIHVILKIGETICTPLSPVETPSTLQKHSIRTGKSNVDMTSTVKINPFVWHCLFIWLHVQVNSINIHEVIDHLFLLKGELNQENWLDSVIVLFILAEAAKLNILCLRALMKLAQDLIPYINHLPEQDKSTHECSWHWEVACAYSMVLGDICLHGTTSEIQKYALIGFQDENTLHIEIKEASLHGLLNFKAPQTSEDCDQIKWIIPYCAVYNLVKICHELLGDTSRDGLRNTTWKALDRHRRSEKDVRILHAIKIAEAEVNGPADPFIGPSAKVSATPLSLAFCQYVGCRLASALSQCFLPPVVPHIPVPKKSVQKMPAKLPVRKANHMEKQVRLSLRQELLLDEPYVSPHPHFVTRTKMDLQKVIEDQWGKELRIRIEEDEEIMKKEQQEKQKKEEEQFQKIMEKREQKLKKTSKPYELSFSIKDTQ